MILGRRTIEAVDIHHASPATRSRSHTKEKTQKETLHVSFVFAQPGFDHARSCHCGAAAAHLISYLHACRRDEIRGAPPLRRTPRCRRIRLSTRKGRLIPASCLLAYS